MVAGDAARVLLFCTGVLTGHFVSWWWVLPGLKRLSGPAFTELMKGALPRFVPAMPILIAADWLASIALLIRLRHEVSATVTGLMLANIAFLLSISILSLIINEPVNQAIRRWSTEMPPADWQVARDRWARGHAIRTAAAVLAFACQMLAFR